MSNSIKITYTNKSAHPYQPKVFLFNSDRNLSFGDLTDEVAWKVLSDVGTGTSVDVTYTVDTMVRVTWGDGQYRSQELAAQFGKSYELVRDDTGLTLKPKGAAADQGEIEIHNNANIAGGVYGTLCKDGSAVIQKWIPFGQKEIVRLKPMLYAAVASQISEGDLVKAAVGSAHLTPIDLSGGISSVSLSMNGNAKDGYNFDCDCRG